MKELEKVTTKNSAIIRGAEDVYIDNVYIGILGIKDGHWHTGFNSLVKPHSSRNIAIMSLIEMYGPKVKK